MRNAETSPDDLQIIVDSVEIGPGFADLSRKAADVRNDLKTPESASAQLQISVVACLSYRGV